MAMHPYMPDSARRRVPHPLPVYLREEFQPFLNRDRPHELLALHHDPKSGSLRYRYTDTGEEVVVPNAWYNQTREMRLSYWAYEVDQAHQRLTSVQRQQAQLRAQGGHLTDSLKDAALLEAHWAAKKAALVEILEAVERGESHA